MSSIKSLEADCGQDEHEEPGGPRMQGASAPTHTLSPTNLHRAPRRTRRPGQRVEAQHAGGAQAWRGDRLPYRTKSLRHTWGKSKERPLGER